MSTLIDELKSNIGRGTLGMVVAVIGSILIATATFTPWLVVAVALA